jgi:hypothetical protein
MRKPGKSIPSKWNVQRGIKHIHFNSEKQELPKFWYRIAIVILFREIASEYG